MDPEQVTFFCYEAALDYAETGIPISSSEAILWNSDCHVPKIRAIYEVVALALKPEPPSPKQIGSFLSVVLRS